MKKKTVLSACLAGSLALAAGQIVYAFPQAPPVGASTGNAILYTVNPDGSITSTYDPASNNPYDGFDDYTVGIRNLSSKPISQLTLSGPNIFGFDGDGQAAFTGNYYGFNSGPSIWSYQGPNNTFVINNANSGTVLFTQPLQPPVETRVDTTWWSMEGAPTSALINNIGLDEFGMGFNTLNPGPNSGTLRIDPTGGLPGNVLVYNLPFLGVPGDVLIHDALATGGIGPVSDIVRFDGAGHAIFYSDNSDIDPGIPPLADTGLPPLLMANVLDTLVETGDPTDPTIDFVGYIPTPNQPGFDPSFPTYTFTSDSVVPEPQALSLLAFAAMGLLTRRRRT